MSFSSPPPSSRRLSSHPAPPRRKYLLPDPDTSEINFETVLLPDDHGHLFDLESFYENGSQATTAAPSVVVESPRGHVRTKSELMFQVDPAVVTRFGYPQVHCRDSLVGTDGSGKEASSLPSVLREKPLPSLPNPTQPEFLERHRTLIYAYVTAFFVLTLLLLILALTNNLPNLFTLAGVGGDVGFRGFTSSGHGDGTYYSPAVGVGACEWQSADTDFVAALNWVDFGTYGRPSASPACGACLKIVGPKGTVKVKVVDKCPVCKKGDVDMSPAAYDVIADETAGRVKISWSGC